MKSIQLLHDYQKAAIQHMLAHKESMLWLDMGLGKLQPDSEPVLTPGGWVPMGDIAPGDKVMGAAGTATEVLNVFPQGEQPIFRITMNDGSWTRVGADHLWYVESPLQKSRGQKGRVITTQQMLDEGLTDAAGNRKFHIPVVEPVALSRKRLQVDPYLMGVILGDGHIRENGSVAITSDETIVDAWSGRTEEHYSEGIVTKHLPVTVIGRAMRTYGLNGKRSWEKHIPPIYLLGSIDQRLALLQGLLDTDGTPIDKGGVEFSSTSEALIDGVAELTTSLGGIARNKSDRIPSYQGGEGRRSWRINVKLPPRFKPFRLQRKLDRWIKPTKYLPARLVMDITPDGKEMATCIKVAAEDHLYVTRHHIVTHNTISTLTAIAHLLDCFEIRGALVVAPLRVVQTVWKQEAANWEHTHHLKVRLIHGKPMIRHRAVMTPADVYVVNYENLPWLVNELNVNYTSRRRPLPFDMIVFDEITKTKSARKQQGSTRLRPVIDDVLPHCSRRVGLTGTPLPNGYVDLFGQYFVLDDGKRLGTSNTSFQSRFFMRPAHGDKLLVTDEGKATLHRLIHDMTVEMSQKDYLGLPEATINEIPVTMSVKDQAAYDKMERDFFHELDSGADVIIDSKAALSNKCLQFANGAMYYGEERTDWGHIHDAKLDALEELIDGAGDPVLLAYQFRHDAERIMQRFKDRVVWVNAKVKGREMAELNKKWNDGLIPVMMGHAASIGHGLNLQYGSHTLAWFGLCWSWELYNQFNKRIAERQGQTQPVVIHHLLTAGTLDHAVLTALKSKQSDEDGLRTAVNEYRRIKYGKAA